ncbi:MAG: PilZ domain-containing protein [Candidatus Omnitrophota bacterium]
MVNLKERRRFIRHPICYPLEFEHATKKINRRCQTLNISQGGLLFLSRRPVDIGSMIVMKLPLQEKLFKVMAKVLHVSKDPDNPKLYDIGVSFCRYADAFKVKLIEQIYLIDEYRTLRSIQLGREVGFRDASEEWIQRYSKSFNKLFWRRDTNNK